MFMPHTERVLVLASKLFGSAAASAIFYQSSGAVSRLAPSDCSPKSDLLEQLVRTATIGVVSIISADGITILLLSLGSSLQRALGAANSAESRVKTMFKLRMHQRMMWTVLVSCLSVHVYIIVAFLANTQEETGSEFLQSWLTSMVSSAILVPLVATIVLATITSQILNHWPESKATLLDRFEATEAELGKEGIVEVQDQGALPVSSLPTTSPPTSPTSLTSPTSPHRPPPTLPPTTSRTSRTSPASPTLPRPSPTTSPTSPTSHHQTSPTSPQHTTNDITNITYITNQRHHQHHQQLPPTTSPTAATSQSAVV
eukprot:TRINITY_DN2724_c0_g1_i3.p1 TRINITY_DN2724_c0_g1~~TRINITY_DN2724_c0_g1_i3.p1  ORF type:complete len:342 (+),score=29.45 TRINITY_DN2724_c0_g1_i3:86-1027(+)